MASSDFDDPPSPLRLGIVARTAYFHDYRARLLEGLPASDFAVTELADIPTGPDRFDIVLVIGIHEHMRVPLVRDYLLAGVQTEQLPCFPTKESRILRNLKRFRAIRDAYDHLFEWSPGIYGAGLHRGNVTYLPHGCDLASRVETEPEFDLLFLGNLPGTAERRARMLEELSQRYRVYPTTYAWGEKKTDAIRNSAICLNIHYYESGGFESPRIFDYLSQHAFVLSERSDECFPFTPAHDFADFVGREHLVQQIDHYLALPEERDRIRENGFRTASQYTFDKVFRRFALEIHRIQRSHRGTAVHLARRLTSRLRAGAFDGSDRLSLAKRRLLHTN